MEQGGRSKCNAGKSGTHLKRDSSVHFQNQESHGTQVNSTSQRDSRVLLEKCRVQVLIPEDEQ